MKRILKRINRLTLTNKLVLMFIALSMIPVIIVGFVSASISSDVLKEKEVALRTEELSLIDKEIDEIIQDINLIAVKYKLDTNVQKLLTKNEQMDIYEINLLKFEIENLIVSFGSQYNYLLDSMFSLLLDSTYIFSLNGIVCSNENVVNVTLDDYYKRDWFQKGIDSGQISFFGDAEIANNNSIIPYVRGITDFRNNELIGFVVININEKLIRKVYLNSFPSSSASIMIVNNNGVVITHTDKEYIGQNISDVFRIGDADIKEKNFEYNLQGRETLVISLDSQKNGWTYYSIVPMSEFNAGSSVIYRVTIVLIAAVVAFIVFLAYFLSRRLTLPVRELSSVMHKAENGDLDVLYSGKNHDELGELGESFNKMTKRLKTSMEQTIRVQKEKMEAELKGLELQINPHFLYNTLSSIIWLADEGKNDEVINVTKSLATFFRISISRGKDMIRVSDEIEHVINYMEIQKTRYGDVIFVQDVDIGIKGLYTLKLLLQPIIENAIYHGLKTIKDGKGIIKLSALRDKDRLVFYVSNNGNTITQERADELNRALGGKEDGNLGVGLNNVNNRIKLNFGQSYGLKFGVKDGYTVVQIGVPIIESEDKTDV